MYEFKCRDCGEYFDESEVIVETHGFTDGLYERFKVCPFCNSSDYGRALEVEAEEVDDEE